MVLLSIQGVSKKFGGLQALRNIRFDLRPSEIVGLIGPNGAGKTTLLNIISGLEKADEGRVLFKDESILGLPAHKVARKKILRTFQVVRLNEDATVLENIMLGTYLWTKAEIMDIWLRRKFVYLEERKSYDYAWETLKLLGLENHANKTCRRLSPGERQLIQLGRVLVSEPELLLLDEPVGGLTVEERSKLSEILLLKKKENITTLLIGHDMPFVMSTSDRIVVLNFGEKIAEGEPTSVVNNPEVTEAYLGGMYECSTS